jgi:hypothetical protein
VATEFATRIDNKAALDFINSVLEQVDGPTGGAASLLAGSTVPEPTSLALLYAGLLSFTFRVRTRQRAFALKQRAFH